MPTASAPNDFSRLSEGNDFFKYRGPSGSSYPTSYGDIGTFEEQPSSWLHGNDFNSMAGDLFSSKNGDNSYGNLGNLSLNLDQIKIGDQTMENVLKALDPSSNTNPINQSVNNSFLNGLNLDSSFKKSSNFDYFKPTNRSNIIKSHAQKPAVTFQQPPTSSQFFSNPDESFVNMTLPAMDTSIIFSDSKTQNSRKMTNSTAAPAFKDVQGREKEQFINFAVQQYRMLAAMNPEMMRSPDNLEELADRETFKYWAKLFVEERERQARIVLNMQKALTEALSGSAAKGPNVMAHLGAASGDYELEVIGRFADQCRKKSQMISQYFNNKQR